MPAAFDLKRDMFSNLKYFWFIKNFSLHTDTNSPEKAGIQIRIRNTTVKILVSYRLLEQVIPGQDDRPVAALPIHHHAVHVAQLRGVQPGRPELTVLQSQLLELELELKYVYFPSYSYIALL